MSDVLILILLYLVITAIRDVLNIVKDILNELLK